MQILTINHPRYSEFCCRYRSKVIDKIMEMDIDSELLRTVFDDMGLSEEDFEVTVEYYLTYYKE